MHAFQSLLALGATLSAVSAHTVITYPGWRGNNLHTNGTDPSTTGSIGIDQEQDGSLGFPYGMQWMYPCGGMPLSQNRTKWPVNGGGLAIQPGWFPGHSLALIYVNIGINEPGQIAPPNMSHPVVHPFQLVGPTNVEYPGSFCLPQIGMPANLSLQVGDNITIQVIEVAQHGAALYNCVDVTLAEPEDVEPITKQNCENTSNINFNLVFTSTALEAGAETRYSTSLAVLAVTVVLVLGTLLL